MKNWFLYCKAFLLTEKNINVRTMRTKLADLWKPAMDFNIKDLKPGIFLFQFYHTDDMK